MYHKTIIMKDVFNILLICSCLVLCICYPFWLTAGLLDTTYAVVATFVACYGSFIGSLLWYISSKKQK